MSEHSKQDAKPSDDLKTKPPVTPKRLTPDRLAQWQQPSPQTPVLPHQPGAKQDGTGPGGPLRRPILKPPKGHARPNLVFLRVALQYELPQPPEVQAAIKEKLIDSGPAQLQPPPTQPIPQQLAPRRQRVRPQLVRTTEMRNLGDTATVAWTQLHDAVVAKWQVFTASFDQAKTQKRLALGSHGVAALRKDLTEKVQAAIDAADRFLKVGRTEDASPGGRPDLKRDKRRAELKELQEEIEPIAVEAKRQRKTIDDLFGDSGQGPDDLGQAIEAKQRGIRFSDLKLTQYGDDKLDRNKSKEDFAGGAVNKVSKLVYGDETRIFKSEALTTTSKANQIGIAGIDKSAPRFGNRNVATKVMSDVLGASVIPDSCFTIHDGKVDLLMQEAAGEEMKDFKKTGFNPKPPSEDVVASLHSQLNELEWTDMLTGQGDRHDGNYMIDAKANSIRITGIDNDFCFGKNQDDYSKYGSSPDAGKTRGGRRGQYWGYNSAEMPPLIDKKAFDTLIGKQFDRDVKPNLIGLLTDEEIAASKSRFEQMQNHARSLTPDYVVDNWKQWRSPAKAEPPGVNATEFLKGNKAIALFQRDFKDLV